MAGRAHLRCAPEGALCLGSDRGRFAGRLAESETQFTGSDAFNSIGLKTIFGLVS